MKNKLFFIGIVMLLLFAGFASAEGRLQIVTTSFPCYDTAKVIAGENADVVMLLPPGSESHSYEPTPTDIIRIQEADLFFYVGGESDTWVDGILESFGENAPRCLTMTECVSLYEEERSLSMEEEEERESDEADETEMDEHVWTSPVNMMAIIESLANVMREIDPDRAGSYASNLYDYTVELLKLDHAIRSVVAQGNRKTLIFGDRFPFLYFVREYSLRYDAAFPGCSEDSEPSVRTVISLIDIIREENIPVVLYIEFSSRSTADILAEETGAKECLFHSCHNVSAEEIENGASYLSLMWQNVQVLKEALQ